jgi:hypothetical protein
MSVTGKRLSFAATVCAVLTITSVAPAAPRRAVDSFQQKLNAQRRLAASVGAQTASNGVVADNFEVLGHHDLGMTDTNADVWVHGEFAYVGTWAFPCTGRGVKIVDVSDVTNPQLVGTLAAREGTSATWSCGRCRRRSSPVT